MAQRSDPFGARRQKHEDQADQIAMLTAMLAQVVEKLDALPQRLAAELQTTRQAASLTRDDRRLLEAALPLIAAAVGEAVWQIRDLATEKPQLFAVLADLAGGPSPSRRIGKLFARGHGVVVGGWRVERIGELRDGLLWRVTRVS